MSHRYIVRNGERSAIGRRSPSDPMKPRGVGAFPVPHEDWQLEEWRRAVNRYEPGAPVTLEVRGQIDRLTLRLTPEKPRLPSGFVTKLRTLTRPRRPR